MYQLHTKLQKKYFRKAIRLHYEKGYDAKRISQVFPVSSATLSNWIAIFAKENGEISETVMKKRTDTRAAAKSQDQEVKELQKRIKELEAKLDLAELKADFYDEMINVAEAKFKIQIRKKAGAKQ